MRYTMHRSPDGEGGAAESNPEQRAAEAETRAAAAVARYRDVVAAGPGLVPEMVRGSTVEEVDASVEAARQAYEALSRKVAERFEAQVPAGNPARSASDAAAEGLKPEAKIALGLRRVGG